MRRIDRTRSADRGRRPLARRRRVPAAGGGTGAGRCSRPDRPRVVEVEKLKDNLFVLQRAAAATRRSSFRPTASPSSTPRTPAGAQPILDKIKELSPKPVTTIINTHTHCDHVSGNVEFPATVDVIVQENTAANMKKMAPVAGLNRSRPPRRTSSTRTAAAVCRSGRSRTRMTLGKRRRPNGSLLLRPRPHERRCVGAVPGLRVVHAGDIFAGNNNIPLLDANNGGSGVDDPGHADEGARGARQARGLDHHRPLHGHDVRRPAGSGPISTATS